MPRPGLLPALLLAACLLPGALGQPAPAPVDLGGLLLRVDDLAGVAKPQETLTFDLRLDAQDGVARRVTFEVIEATPGFMAAAPAPITLPSPQGREAVVPFMVLVPYRNGYVDDEGAVVLRVTSTPTGNGSAAPATHDLAFDVAARGTYVPAPGAALLAPLLAAVALAASRTRP